MVFSGIREFLAVRFLERTTAGRLCETRRLVEEVWLEETYARDMVVWSLRVDEAFSSGPGKG